MMGYRPPQYRRGLKRKNELITELKIDIDHPNIEGD